MSSFIQIKIVITLPALPLSSALRRSSEVDMELLLKLELPAAYYQILLHNFTLAKLSARAIILVLFRVPT